MSGEVAVRVIALTLLAFSGLVTLANGASAQLVPESREYKLMLIPDRFGSGDPAPVVEELGKALRAAVAEHLDKRDGGKSRLKRSFDDSKQRRIVFRDTAECILSKNGYTLRERVKFKKGKPDLDGREATLKFRSPDFLVAADARPKKGKAKFEEDIGPLLVRVVNSGGETAAFAKPPSMRSVFSMSLTRDLDPADQLLTLNDAASIYPDLEARLKSSTVGPLVEGPVFRELVFEGALIDLGEKIDAEVDVSVWYAEDGFGSAAPSLAELSFKYSVDDGAGPAARRALTLFTALQERLNEWLSADHETKTSAALPKACR